MSDGELRFPTGFMWGTATAAHQVEGGNVLSDCWAVERTVPSLFKEPSGDAIDQYHRFADDMAILASLGLKAYRFSIEWARIEPEEGDFSKAVLDHYQRCIDACLARGIEPVITFHHFTLPLWVARRGGFTAPDFADRFARFCERAARALRGFTIACTLNELNLPLFLRDLFLERQQSANGQRCLAACAEALNGSVDHFFLLTPREALLDQGMLAHEKGRDAIKSVQPHVKVGATLAIRDEQAEPGAEATRDRRRAEFHDVCLDRLRGDDFIGVQTYSRYVSRRDGTGGPEPGHPLTIMGYEDRPQALAATCRYVWERTRTPILVTENGWAGDDDNRRQMFIVEALRELHGAIRDGVDVRGYFYWSLFDNFEWMAGYRPKFGLIGVDRITQCREVRHSAVMFGEIARSNCVDRHVTTASAVVVASAGAPVGL